MLTTKQYKAEKRKLYGGIDRNEALKEGFRYEANTVTNQITWRKEGVSLSFHLDEVKYLNNRRLHNMWAFLYYWQDLEVISISEGIIKSNGLYFELDHPFQCDRHSDGVLLKVWLEENSNQKNKYWVTSDNRQIPFEELSDYHLANIIGKKGEFDYPLPEEIADEVKKRFGLTRITERQIKKYVCEDGVSIFKNRYNLHHLHDISVSFLVDHIDFSRPFIAKIIKNAIKGTL